MNDPNNKRRLPLDIDSDLPERLWGFGDHAAQEGHPATDRWRWARQHVLRHRRAGGGTPGYGARLPLLGLLVGCGLYLRYPPSYTATATLLLKAGPNQHPARADRD